MTVHNQTSLNAKAKEHTEWAIAWLDANDIDATISQKGSHPYFEIERYGQKRKVTFSSSPSVIQPNAVFREVRIAALELGYTEKVDREGRAIGAFAALKAQEPVEDTKFFKGVAIPKFPEQFRDADKRKFSQDADYLAHVKERKEFVAKVYTLPGVTHQSIYEALVKAGYDIKSTSVISNDVMDITTGKGQAERTKERKEAGLTRTRAADRLPSAKAVPKFALNALGLLVEEAARGRLADLFAVRDNLKRDADAYDDMRAQLKKGGTQLEALLSALSE